MRAHRRREIVVAHTNRYQCEHCIAKHVFSLFNWFRVLFRKIHLVFWTVRFVSSVSVSSSVARILVLFASADTHAWHRRPIEIGNDYGNSIFLSLFIDYYVVASRMLNAYNKTRFIKTTIGERKKWKKDSTEVGSDESETKEMVDLLSFSKHWKSNRIVRDNCNATASIETGFPGWKTH